MKNKALTFLALLASVSLLAAAQPFNALKLTGDADANGFQFKNLPAPGADNDAVRRVYVTAGYQPLDGDLTSIAGITTTSYGRSLLALANAAAGRVALDAASAAQGALADSAVQPIGEPASGDIAVFSGETGKVISGSMSVDNVLSAEGGFVPADQGYLPVSVGGVNNQVEWVQPDLITVGSAGIAGSAGENGQLLHYDGSQLTDPGGEMWLPGGIDAFADYIGLKGNANRVTNLNATNLGSGTVPDARFPATLPVASGVNLTALNGSNVASGTVPAARLATATTSAQGASELATDAEVQTGTDTGRTITPSGLAAWWTWIKTQTATIAGAWTFSANAIFNGTNNTAPNQVGVSPSSSGTIMTRQQAEKWMASPKFFILREEFGGAAASGSIGQMGWLINGATNAVSSNSLTGTSATIVLAPTFGSALPTGVIYWGAVDTVLGQGSVRKLDGQEFNFVINSASFDSLGTAWSVGVGGHAGTDIPDRITPKLTMGIRFIPPSTAAWAAATAYTLGANRRPTVANGYKYICTTAGTSSGTEPTWPTTYAGTVTDGTVTWSCAGDEGNANIVFFVSGTDPMTTVTATASATTEVATTSYVFKIRLDTTNAYFSINGGAETSIAMTNLGSLTRLAPYFASRNDLNVTAADSWVMAEFFSAYLTNVSR